MAKATEKVQETELQGDAAEIRASQPSGISSGTFTVARKPGLYMGSMHLERQKLGSSKREEQLSLWEQAEGVQATGTEVSGLDLTVSEDKALSALQILLDRTNYNGNLPGEKLHTETYQGTLPRLAVSYSEFFDAYGLEPGRTGHHKREQEALEALRSLAETKRRVYYTRRRYKGKEVHYDVVAWTASIIAIETLHVYRDLTGDEVARVQAGEDRPGRQSGFVVTFSSLFIDQIETFHFWKSTTLHEEIRQLRKGKRTTPTHIIFHVWLLTLDRTPFKISKDKLVTTLRLDDLYFRQRQKARAEKQIAEAIEVALELKFLTGWQQDATGMFTFHLNPERCTRVEAKRRRALPEPE